MESREIRKGSNTSNSVTEANITIEGHQLTFQESMTLRVAINSFLIDLSKGSMGTGDTGRRIAASYRLHARAIQKYIMERKHS